MSIGFLKMRKKKSQSKKKVLVDTHICLRKDDWEATQKLAVKKETTGGALVRVWMRDGLEKEGKKG
jgi:hypothetical protein